jgi:hypothetical protein
MWSTLYAPRSPAAAAVRSLGTTPNRKQADNRIREKNVFLGGWRREIRERVGKAALLNGAKTQNTR